MRVHALFGEMSDARRPDRRGARGRRGAAKSLPTRTAAQHLRARSQARRHQEEIVATKEGGAITGEERIREHLDTPYGAIRWEGKPARYQIERIETLARELADVEKEFDVVAGKARSR